VKADSRLSSSLIKLEEFVTSLGGAVGASFISLDCFSFSAGDDAGDDLGSSNEISLRFV
jgi:hypothetical protein